MTGEQAAAIIVGTIEQAAITEAKTLLKADMPKFIKYLQNAEKTHPGFLGIGKDVDMILVDIAELALGWASID